MAVFMEFRRKESHRPERTSTGEPMDVQQKSWEEDETVVRIGLFDFRSLGPRGNPAA